MVLFVAAAAAESTETGPSIIPKWRLSVKAFPYSYSDDPVFGVHYRIDKRHDLGLEVEFGTSYDDGSDVSESTVGEGYYDEDDHEGESHEISVYTDLRRWSHTNDRVSWYAGARHGVGYSYTEAENSDSDSRHFRSYEYTFVGMWFTVGADVRLLDHVSVSASLIPVGIKYAWSKNKSESEGVMLEGDDYKYRNIDKRDYLIIEGDLGATAYLTLWF
jgi:hypothetical protein